MEDQREAQQDLPGGGPSEAPPETSGGRVVRRSARQLESASRPSAQNAAKVTVPNTKARGAGKGTTNKKTRGAGRGTKKKSAEFVAEEVRRRNHKFSSFFVLNTASAG
jgi:hypothetical protein